MHGRSRTIVSIKIGHITYTASSGRRGACWITTWQQWCRHYAVSYWRNGVDLLKRQATGRGE